MSRIYRLARKLLPASWRLAWSRSRIEHAYGKSITAARQAKDYNEVQSLKSAMQFELELQREEEDAHQTKQLLRKAMRLCVPVPPVQPVGGANSSHWRLTGSEPLTGAPTSASTRRPSRPTVRRCRSTCRMPWSGTTWALPMTTPASIHRPSRPTARRCGSTLRMPMAG